MADANSVLFDPNDPYYQPDDPNQAANLQYYQTDYAGDASYTPSPSYQNYGYPPISPQAYDGYAYPSPVGGRPVEISLLSAFGSGGLPGEPPLLEDDIAFSIAILNHTWGLVFSSFITFLFNCFFIFLELDINFSHVITKTFAVLNPLKAVDPHIMDDVDLVGPLVFCVLLGITLLISGGVSFGSIYGVAMVGCASMFCILNLMSEGGIDFYRTASVLGYCLLPIVLLAMSTSVLKISSLYQNASSVLAPFVVSWATFAASKIFVSILGMQDQRLLVAYPVALFYTCFSLITIF